MNIYIHYLREKHAQGIGGEAHSIAAGHCITTKVNLFRAFEIAVELVSVSAAIPPPRRCNHTPTQRHGAIGLQGTITEHKKDMSGMNTLLYTYTVNEREKKGREK